jgi:hypothetical protein
MAGHHLDEDLPANEELLHQAAIASSFSGSFGSVRAGLGDLEASLEKYALIPTYIF